jgi:hypothetical protein
MNYEEIEFNDQFYTDTFQVWAKLSYKDPKNVQEVIKQPLWRNSHIKIGGKTVKYNDWNLAGISKIIHLIDNKGKLASETYIRNKFGIVPKQLTYTSLIHSIPAEWKKMIKTESNILGYPAHQGCCLLIDNKEHDIDQITTRDIYLHMIKSWKIKPAAGKIKWIEIYDDMNLDEEFWQYIYETPNSLTKNSKILMTQYKIVNRILAVNYNLKIWGKSDTDLCIACNQVDTIQHFIYECPKTLVMWKAIQTWWKTIFHFSIELSILEILFGIPNENKDNAINIYNYVILHAKYYIYIYQKKEKRYKYVQSTPSNKKRAQT